MHSTLYDAVASGASDIHLENDAHGLIIRYRIDGVLNTIAQAPGREMAEQVVSRIKVMAELDIAERRVPQDGRFKVMMRGREIDLRVSIMPGVFGEDAVLRILDRQQLADELKGVTLDRLGFDPITLARIRRLSHEPYGMFLVTGPTGSGKTTTLYASITEINTGRDKIITIEDPVEYQLPGILQIPVNEKKGLTFARGLRSILRHDPEKIMVGEIRDPETAQIAVQSALTGHLVFTTVHANSVYDVIGRFLHMGVDPYSFVSALNGILAQRLVRVNCPHCLAPQTPTPELLADSGLEPAAVRGWEFLAGRGCGHCRGSGYRGRKAIAEMMLLNDELRELIAARAPIRTLKEAAARRRGEPAADRAGAGSARRDHLGRDQPCHFCRVSYASPSCPAVRPSRRTTACPEWSSGRRAGTVLLRPWRNCSRRSGPVDRPMSSCRIISSGSSCLSRRPRGCAGTRCRPGWAIAYQRASALWANGGWSGRTYRRHDQCWCAPCRRNTRTRLNCGWHVGAYALATSVPGWMWPGHGVAGCCDAPQGGMSCWNRATPVRCGSNAATFAICASADSIQAWGIA